jgi:hypothetical protein
VLTNAAANEHGSRLLPKENAIRGIANTGYRKIKQLSSPPWYRGGVVVELLASTTGWIEGAAQAREALQRWLHAAQSAG